LRTFATETNKRTLQFAQWLILSLAILACWYTYTSGAAYFYTRYLAPLTIIGVLIGIQLYSMVFRWNPRIAAAGITGLALPVLVVTAMLWRADRLFAGAPHSYLLEQVPLVEKYVPQDAWVAAGQSGTLGFFRPRVVNVDGKVNGDALLFQHSMPAYLRQIRVNYLCDWPGEIRRYLGDRPEKNGWRLIASGIYFQIWKFDGESDHAVR
jgi:hypothetical protein